MMEMLGMFSRMAGPVGPVVSGLERAAAAAMKFARAVNQTIDELQQYAPQTSVALARGQAQMTMQDIRHAQLMDSDMSRFVELQNELTVLVRDIYRALMKAALDNIVPVLEVIVAAIKNAVDTTVDVATGILDAIGPLGEAVLKGMSPIFDALIRIAREIKAFRDKDPVGIDPFLDDFFNMTIPAYKPPARQPPGAFVPGNPMPGPKLMNF